MKMDKQTPAVATLIISLIINCLILTNYSNAQNRASGGKKNTKAKSSKSVGKKQRGKKIKDDKKEQDEGPRVIRLDNRADQSVNGPFSQTATAFGVTSPIRDMPAVRDGQPLGKGEVKIDSENNEVIIERADPNAVSDGDSLIEISRETAKLSPSAMPGPAVTFNGILGNDVINTLLNGSMPPDTVGDVGPNHYVQAANYGVFRVFNKATGAPLTAIAPISTLFAGLPTGNPCRTIDDGDPIVNYDPLADRWVISQFQVSAAPNGQCIAVSVTSDRPVRIMRISFRSRTLISRIIRTTEFGRTVII